MNTPPTTAAPTGSAGTPAEFERFYSVNEVAAIFGVHHQAVRRVISAGQLPASKVGGSLRIAPADLRAYLDASRVVATPTKKAS